MVCEAYAVGQVAICWVLREFVVCAVLLNGDLARHESEVSRVLCCVGLCEEELGY